MDHHGSQRAKHMQVFPVATDSWFCWLTPLTQEQQLISEIICCSGCLTNASTATEPLWSMQPCDHVDMSVFVRGCEHPLIHSELALTQLPLSSAKLYTSRCWQGGCRLIKSEVEVYLWVLPGSDFPHTASTCWSQVLLECQSKTNASVYHSSPGALRTSVTQTRPHWGHVKPCGGQLSPSPGCKTVNKVNVLLMSKMRLMLIASAL